MTNVSEILTKLYIYITLHGSTIFRKVKENWEFLRNVENFEARKRRKSTREMERGEFRKGKKNDGDEDGKKLLPDFFPFHFARKRRSEDRQTPSTIRVYGGTQFLGTG